VETSSWSSVVSEMDYPGRCHWALGVDADGHPGCYVGDGGHHDRIWWCFAGSSLLRRLGERVHLAFTVDGPKVQLWVDGNVAGQDVTAEMAEASSPAAEGAQGAESVEGTERVLRIGAAAESGLTDHFLDGDVSDVALFSRRLTRHEIVALTEDKAMSQFVPVGRESLIAHWPLRERSGTRAADASGHGRDATLIINTPTLNIPGPSASTAIGRPGYDPDADPTRGGSIRFASDDLVDCGWPAAAEITIPEDAESGAYLVRVTLAGAGDEPLELPFVVVRPEPRRQGSIALIYATFTWTAYARRVPRGRRLRRGLPPGQDRRGRERPPHRGRRRRGGREAQRPGGDQHRKGRHPDRRGRAGHGPAPHPVRRHFGRRRRRRLGRPGRPHRPRPGQQRP
jgi:hypothetical protein